jgi:hypothetical protein
MEREVWFVYLVQQPINPIYTPLEHHTIPYTKNYWKKTRDCKLSVEGCVDEVDILQMDF